MYYVYVLRDKPNNKFYIGYTADIERRIKEHNCGNVHTTLRYSKKELIFYEAFFTKEDATRREDYFKTAKGKRTLRLMLRESIK